MGFPGSSAGKESTCNARDPSSIPGSGRSPGEGIGYLLQYSWASLVAQAVKNPPAVQETWVSSLGWEDPLEEGMATHSSILAWGIPMDRLPMDRIPLVSYSPWGCGVRHDWETKHSTALRPCKCYKYLCIQMKKGSTKEVRSASCFSLSYSLVAWQWTNWKRRSFLGLFYSHSIFCNLLWVCIPLFDWYTYIYVHTNTLIAYMCCF